MRDIFVTITNTDNSSSVVTVVGETPGPRGPAGPGGSGGGGTGATLSASNEVGAALVGADGENPFAATGRLYAASGVVSVEHEGGTATLQLSASLFNDAGELVEAGDPVIETLSSQGTPEVYLYLDGDALCVGVAATGAWTAEACLQIASVDADAPRVYGEAEGGYYGYGSALASGAGSSAVA